MPYKPSEQHDNLVSNSYGKYDDVRMPWVGRYPGQRVLSVTDTTQRVVEKNENRVWLLLQNDGANPIYLNFGEAAVANSTARLNATGGSLLLDRFTPWPDQIDAICAAGLTSTLLIQEVSQETESGRGE